MIDLDLIDALEGDVELDKFSYYNVVQAAINNGVAWKLQGSYGREMMAAIKNGYCLLGKERAVDYWGTTIPSRDDVRPGAAGSLEYVAERNGIEWANDMAAT
jgi:hypothetical protein